jgi:phosphoheptose isomerase
MSSGTSSPYSAAMRFAATLRCHFQAMRCQLNAMIILLKASAWKLIYV